VTTAITYQKGAWVLHMLRERVGHDAFRKGIRHYYAKYFNANATTDNFREEMEKVSKQDLKTFFDQWLYKPENLKLSVQWTYDATEKTIKLQVDQVQHSDLVFDFPLEIEIHHPDTNTSELMKFNINRKGTVIPIKYEKAPASIRFDPRTVLLAEIDIKPSN
jgi:aminopeptidase N